MKKNLHNIFFSMKDIPQRKFSLCLLGFVLWITSCSFSPPAAPSSSKKPPNSILKFVSYSQNHSLVGYFSLSDAVTNQVASSGQLRIYVYTSTSLILDSATENRQQEAMKIRKALYDNTFTIAAANFHWETFGSIFTVRDLAFRFTIPYTNFDLPARQGQSATIQIDFRPDGGAHLLSASRNIFLN